VSTADSPDVGLLRDLFARQFGEQPAIADTIQAHGSDRRIYRLGSADRTVIGVVNASEAENAAFVSFSRHFRSCDLPVPEIFAISDDGTALLEEDLGDSTLFEMLGRARAAEAPGIPEEIAAVYERVVQLLPEFQVRGGQGIDYDVCFPRAQFDRQSMRWDLNYFKYYFLKLAQIPFHEQELENDFELLTDFLLAAPADFFLYRDFQSRNVMVREGRPWFIDYQGGRRGALQYDLASLLVDAKANLPFPFRERLVETYLEALSQQMPVDRAQFLSHYDGFTLIRILQAMGAYGFRGFYERKPQFLQSVPYAIRNLEALLGSTRLPIKLPALFAALQRIVQSTRLREIAPVPVSLTVQVQSFSFRSGYPVDESGHGGGFVFDCRSLPNPGREPGFAALTGEDAAVDAWLEPKPEVQTFLTRVRDIVDAAVDTYARRHFTHLSVAFGCTGGQHRSVHCARRLATHLREHKGVTVELSHRDMPRFETGAQS